jgi:hypothetical protein
MKTENSGKVYEESSRVTLEEYNREINDAMAEVARGESYLHEDVLEMSKHW